ncbi:MAG: NAD+ kinase [Methylococcaceae bacterium NSP1-2]|nr:NAD(+)/NADH kinase [Methylococcaceae bacterium]OYV18780.1 MAG: NAD+ kinase [Methylococcaceae bacterium NSP1-2]
MQTSFQTIGIIGKPSDPSIAETLAVLCGYLKQQHYTVFIDSASAHFIEDQHVTACSINALARHCDLVIAVGGDGTFLAAARAIVDYDIPLIGINLGRLGFLVDISPNELPEKLTPSMIEIVTKIDGMFLNSQRSDGLIVSTPTGSTAYSLSAGGPILYPSLNALVLVPLNPHTLSNRPIVIHDSAEIEISFCQTKQINALVTCDHIEIPEVFISDKILIKKDPKPIRILHPEGHDFFHILRNKLNWSSGYHTVS